MDLFDNGLMARLSPDEQACVASVCHPMILQPGAVLAGTADASGVVHFLTASSVALVVRHAGGHSLGLGVVGAEGAIGLQCALGLGAGIFTPVVQTGGGAWRADGHALARVVADRPPLQLAFSRYLWQVSEHVASMAALSHCQDVRSRLAAWLVLSDQRADVARLDLTQAHLAAMLGVRRVSVSLAATDLKERGLIDYQRGRIRLIDRAALVALSHVETAPPEGVIASTPERTTSRSAPAA